MLTSNTRSWEVIDKY